MSRTSEWTELRDASGVFVGMCDVPASAGWAMPRVRIPVPARAIGYMHAIQCPRLTFQVVEIALAKWRDADGSPQMIWRLEDGSREQLERCSRIMLSGSTCETAYGHAVKCIEAMVRLIGMLKLAHLDVSHSTKH